MTWEDPYRTCRICKAIGSSREMFKPAEKAWYHWRCYVDRHSFETLVDALGPHCLWKLGQFPAKDAYELGLVDRIARILGGVK